MQAIEIFRSPSEQAQEGRGFDFSSRSLSQVTLEFFLEV